MSDFPSKNVQSGKRLHKRNPRYFSDDDSLSDEENIKKKKPSSSHNQSAIKTPIYMSDSSSSSNEQKENRRPNKSNIQLPLSLKLSKININKFRRQLFLPMKHRQKRVQLCPSHLILHHHKIIINMSEGKSIIELL